jgi:hypothetical protein
MTQLGLPDPLTLAQVAAGLCLVALVARRRAMRRSDWEGAVSRLSGRIRGD